MKLSEHTIFSFSAPLQVSMHVIRNRTFSFCVCFYFFFLSGFLLSLCVYGCEVCVYVCVCDEERERERDKELQFEFLALL